MPVIAYPSGAPTTSDYLVGSADAGLSAEIVVGTAPGGELGGTWASPTVASTHSGSAHIGDHTHAATGTGATGGGTTISPQTISSNRRFHQTILTPAQLTANTDDWAPTDYDSYSLWAISSDANRNLTGIVAPALSNGSHLWLYNAGSFTITLMHNVTSTAANRFQLVAASNLALATLHGVHLLYYGARWHSMGAG